MSNETTAASAPVHRVVGRICRATYHGGRFLDSTWYIEWADNYVLPVRVDIYGNRTALFGYTIKDCDHYLETGAWIPFDPPNPQVDRAGEQAQGEQK